MDQISIDQRKTKVTGKLKGKSEQKKISQVVLTFAVFSNSLFHPSLCGDGARTSFLYSGWKGSLNQKELTLKTTRVPDTWKMLMTLVFDTNRRPKQSKINYLAFN